MNEVVVNVAAEINRLHSELEATKQKLDAMAPSFFEKAIAIGEMLTDQKTALKHGEWIPWLAANVGFDARTAQNYMRVFKGKDKYETVSHLGFTEALRLLAEPKRKEKPEPEKETEQETEESESVPNRTMEMEAKENMAAAKDAIAAIKRIIPGTNGSYEATQKVCVYLQKQHNRKPKTSRSA